MSDDNVISKLRELSETPRNPRNYAEWPVPVYPSHLKELFRQFDELTQTVAKLSDNKANDKNSFAFGKLFN